MLLLVACTSGAQAPIKHAEFVVMAKPPSLPTISEDMLPGEGWLPGSHKLRGQTVIFDTWRSSRRRLAVLNAGTPVTLLSGLCDVSRPDIVTVTSPIPKFQLYPGDSLLRYTYRGEGFADFWVKGRWYGNADGAFITEADGTGCQSHCKARVTEPGRKIWWFCVRLTDDRVGWTDAVDSLTPN